MAFDADNFQVYNIVSEDYPTLYGYNAGADSLATVAAANYFADLLYRVRSGDKLLISTTTSGLSFSCTFRNTGSAIIVDWDNTLRFEAVISDVSTAQSVFTSVPPVGVIVQVYGVQYGQVTVAAAEITYEIGGTAITGGAYTIETADTAGDSHSATPTALNITSGTNPIEIITDGASTTAVALLAGFKMICPAQI